MNWQQRAVIARATLQIIDRGIYLNQKSESIDLGKDLASAVLFCLLPVLVSVPLRVSLARGLTALASCPS
ncbi:MAG: hypothetical protein QNJ38_13420 [Prochloraceae cyanobacterium]|nr:hypothetical protein [Prochloraceae cyanobacterium]